MLRRDGKQLFHRDGDAEVLDIDTGVLRAFLFTESYRHGARSMESIIAMSMLSGKTRFERSSLPAEPQLDLHAHASRFLALVQRLDLEGGILERLAEAAHLVYCADALNDGFDWGEDTDAYLKANEVLRPFAARARTGRTEPALVSYGNLPEQTRAANRELVRDIPNKLATGGYVMRPARGDSTPFSFPPEIVEELAEREHDRWMRSKLDAGWRYGPVRHDKGRTHPAMLPWRKQAEDEARSRFGAALDRIGEAELTESEKDKDRALIRGLSRIVAAAGYAVERVRNESAPA